MNQNEHQPQLTDYFSTRRQFLQRFGMGFGALGLATLMEPEMFSGISAQAATSLSPLAPRQPHFPGKAKRVIHIFSQGGPSHLDTWDPKPELAKYADKNIPLIGGIPLVSPFKFTKAGKSGVEGQRSFPAYR